MDTDGLKAAIAALAVLCGVIVGAFGGYHFALETREAPEDVSPAPQKRQGDSSLVLERQPDPSPPPAPHALPRGAVEERRVTVRVQPARPSKPASEPAKSGADPVTVTLSLVRQGEGRRVIASSPDGQILGGLDVPIRPLTTKVERSWALGVSWDGLDGRYGAWAERDLGRFRLGAELYERERGGIGAAIRIGWTW